MVPVDQHPAGMANGVWPKARAAAIGGADIKGYAGNVERGFAFTLPAGFNGNKTYQQVGATLCQCFAESA